MILEKEKNLTMKLPQSFQLTTENLRFRIPDESDFPHVFSATRHEGFNDGMPWEPPRNLEDLKLPLMGTVQAWIEGNDFSFSIEDLNTSEFMGRISIRKTDYENVWNIGFWTHPIHQGKGIMTEACREIINFGFTTLNAIRIEAEYATWNIASEKVLKKNGMQFVKFLEKGFEKKGTWVSENLMAIDKNKWKNINYG